MGYDLEKWAKRLQYRTDLSGFVYHLTKVDLDDDGNRIMEATERLVKIIKERKLNGSTTQSGFITGNRKAICFQDAPLSGIAQNVVHEREFKKELGDKVRYVGVGLAFPKSYIFQQGGRPVMYEKKETAKKILPKDEWWRIVDFDLTNKENIIDWTHEREWRLPADEFNFDLTKVVILLPNGERYKEFIERLPSEDLTQIRGIIQTSPLVF